MSQTQHTLSRGYRRYHLNDITSTSTSLMASANNIVTEWVSRVVNGGGSTPSTTTQTALATFYVSLYTNSLINKMININCVAPDSLQAAITPFIATAGSGSSGVSNSWGNTGLISGNLSISGLQGDGSHNLNTGIIPGNDLLLNSVGITLYNTISDTVNTSDMASYNSATQTLQLLPDYTGTTYFDCWNETGGTGRISAISNISGLGYTSGNRTSNSRSDIYTANSTVSHSSIANSTSTSIGTRPTVELPVFCWNHNNSYAQYSKKRFSFIGIHNGLSASESSAFFNAIQKLRMDLGGGYI